MTGFDAFWAAWPRNPRKGGKAECLKRWIKHHHETQTETIVAHVNWMKTTADWLKDNGAYIPMPLTYLNQQRWDGAEIPKPVECDTEAAYQRQLEASIRAFERTVRR
jgi:hypothetical protein